MFVYKTYTPKSTNMPVDISVKIQKKLITMFASGAKV